MREKMTIGSFTLIRNEIYFIDEHLKKWLPYLDEMCFFCGDSTDGTLQVLRKYHDTHKLGHKITLFENKEPADFQEDYIRLFNECMQTLKTDIGIFLHPDMLPENAEELRKLPADMIAATMNLESFGGEPYGQLLKITGRGRKWKNIYRLRNPNLGAHYVGYYGAYNEDVYFSEITGDEHQFHNDKFEKYPYPVFHSALEVKHYSDVRPYARRLARMLVCLENQGHTKEYALKNAILHPRVTLKDGKFLKFTPVENKVLQEV